MKGNLKIFFRSDTNAQCVGLSLFDERIETGMQENGRYEYELDAPGYSLREQAGIVRHSRIAQDCERGWIEPGNYVGLLKLVLVERDSGAEFAVTHVEVRSRKLSYESEYRSMLESIADRCADFLLQLDSPVEQRFLPDDTEHEATLAQRLYFLKSLLAGEEFQSALQRIVSMPHTRWEREPRTVDVRSSRRLGRAELRQFASAKRRLATPEAHPLHGRLHSVPECLEVMDKRDSVDTPENRFVKYALMMFLQCLEAMLLKFAGTGGTRYPGLQEEVRFLMDGLEETLSHEVFKEVSPPALLPLNSPVLQRKEGYRQVLRAWMLFELAARLSWTGGDDVYAGGKRDAAALYEYWVFFRLLDLVADLFALDRPLVADLLNDSELVLKLKAGKHLPIRGMYTGAGRPLRIEFSYNRSFGVSPYPAPGSWTRQMRPDYTLSLWPADFGQEEAEAQELITHVHFDAKYKVDRLVELFGDGTDPDAEKQEQRSGTYKRGDLLKMHAYRDAIRRSAGAYVLYPGQDDGESRLQGFHELLPGLGAFPLRPNAANDGSPAILRFLKEVVAHVCNRASQYEQQTWQTYRIHKNQPPPEVREPMPEWADGVRTEPATDVYVLHGWVPSDSHLTWYQQSGLYNFRTEDRRGSLRLKSSVSGARYLLLHGQGEYRGGARLFRVVSDGPRVFSAETLIEKGYPGTASQPFYLVYEIRPLPPGDPLSVYDWDLTNIPGIGGNRASALPERGIALSDLMKGAVIRLP